MDIDKRLSDDMMPIFPDESIICKECKYRMLGKIGYKNRYCEKYKDGKPYEVLFDHKACEYYERG